MGRKAVEVKTLHGYTIEQLKDIREKTDDNFKKEIILAIMMRYQGIKSETIENILGKSRPTILKYIHKWNEYGLEATEDHRGGSIGTFTDEMKDDLLRTLVETKPIDHGFNSYSWTCNLLADYIKNKYDIQYSGEWIRRIIKAENFTYKKAQRKSSLAKESEQLAFKKNETTTEYCRKFF
ncbi:winged helix-turn-helix domain-containing protein [Tissierella pigra]|uniref:helix-turn-helix domain-containing protein n=1 Tax=Tissierella pigra TaxID=2607614 RepID=UPI001C111B43|nr:winged helix-turn-helix domain-containing protein [Tissierella pigra]MBU5425336.1 winged helix-turn-helix domain-containing protein [Tissierella pigra]MBU5425981.1 winged helix-turn-helix domain-containing protein [Tissierella pigra]MBU5426267.1 winged helix-turn-helix domain-containing protein [Tissierella pigra]MBU5428068.1 winged helix-turn-helix domain-containing protein [Tissierella pigra]